MISHVAVVEALDAAATHRLAVNPADEEAASGWAELVVARARHRVPVKLEPVVHLGNLVAHRLGERPARSIVDSGVGEGDVGAVGHHAPPASPSTPSGVSARPTWIRGIVSGSLLLSVVPPAVV